MFLVSLVHKVIVVLFLGRKEKRWKEEGSFKGIGLEGILPNKALHLSFHIFLVVLFFFSLTFLFLDIFFGIHLPFPFPSYLSSQRSPN